jgi:Phage integrase family
MAMRTSSSRQRELACTTPTGASGSGYQPGRPLACLTLAFTISKHTAGTALLEEGVNIKTAQERLGHASPRTTLAVYAQATVQADREGGGESPRDR